ncbi:MAG TPA: hypothetical protein VNA24_11120 [Hyalangium sp.]|jgi:uncharacterized membrane protein YeaQ/YmgE (transglycosylase-associated protein family)|nr:hypothetical protein [Hyalangium sp.]
METLAFMAVGLATGLLCRFIVPNPRPLGLIRMLIIGMVGGVFGGALGGSLQSGLAAVSLGAPSLIGAFLVALIAIFVVLGLSRQRRHA